MAISLSGMASGLDTDSIISQLMAIEQNKVTAVQKRQVVRHAAQDGPDQRSRPSSTRSRRRLPTCRPRRCGSPRRRPARRTRRSSTSTVLGGAGIGGHTIQINKLASSAQHGFSYTARRHDRRQAELRLQATTRATRSRSTSPSRRARPRPTSPRRSTPTTRRRSTPPWSRRAASSGSSSPRARPATARTSPSTRPRWPTRRAMAELPDLQARRTDLNADVLVDGVAPTTPAESNVIENAIPGVRLTLKGVSTSPVSVNTTQPAIDTDAITKKVQALVDAYNNVVTSTRSELDREARPDGDHDLGPAEGPAVRRLRHGLDAQPAQEHDDADAERPRPHRPRPTSASASRRPARSTEDAKAGKLVLDTDKLKTAHRRRLHEGQGALRRRRRDQGHVDALIRTS